MLHAWLHVWCLPVASCSHAFLFFPRVSRLRCRALCMCAGVAWMYGSSVGGEHGRRCQETGGWPSRTDGDDGAHVLHVCCMHGIWAAGRACVRHVGFSHFLVLTRRACRGACARPEPAEAASTLLSSERRWLALTLRNDSDDVLGSRRTYICRRRPIYIKKL